MQAVILAAGRGSRLGNTSAETPKCLLEVGRRRLIEHQLETLSEAGVGPVLMVLGYCADEIREVVGIQSEYVVNSRWSTTNSLYSFSLCRDWVNGPILVLNSDILLHPGIVDRLLAAEDDAIAYDSASGDGGEHMKVEIENGRLLSMSKALPAERVSGENVGILKFTEESARVLLSKADDRLTHGGESEWLGSAVCELARERRIGTVDVAGLPWGEVDFPYDLGRVRKEVWPAIQRHRQRASSPRRFLPWVAIAALTTLLVYLAANAWTRPAESIWNVVDVDRAQRVEISSGTATRQWWRLDTGDYAEFDVNGPTEVRVDTRLLTDPGVEDKEPYVIDVLLDGNSLDWFKDYGFQSGSWTHPDHGVCKRNRVRIDVPDGPHKIRVRLIASKSGSCLARFSRKEADSPED